MMVPAQNDEWSFRRPFAVHPTKLRLTWPLASSALYMTLETITGSSNNPDVNLSLRQPDTPAWRWSWWFCSAAPRQRHDRILGDPIGVETPLLSADIVVAGELR
jgi:hypothetical protein